jgi:hypothetical protein
MKLITLILAAFLPFYKTIFSQTLTFNHTFGGKIYDDARSVVATSDGGVVFTGLTKSGDDSTGDTYLTRLNAAGAVVFQKKYGLSLEDGGNGLLQTSDGGYLIIGHTAFTYGEACDGYLIKTDAQGNEIWRSFVGGNLDDVTNKAIEMPDGSFRICGKTQDENHNFHALFAAVANDGRVIFTKLIPSEQQEIIFNLKKAPDGNLILVGYAFESNKESMLLLKCDTEGNLIWRKKWGNAPKQRVFDVAVDENSRSYAVGESLDEAGNLIEMQLTIVDSDGNTMQTMTDENLKGVGRLTACDFDANGFLVVAGTMSDVNSLQKPLVAWLNTDLNVLEKKEINQLGNCRSRHLVLQNDAVIVVGNTENAAFVAKIVRENGVLKATEVQASTSLLFPNPMNNYTYLKTGLGFGTKTLELISTEGKVIRQVKFTNDDIFINRNELTAGVYSLRVENESGKRVLLKKLVIE